MIPAEFFAEESFSHIADGNAERFETVPDVFFTDAGHSSAAAASDAQPAVPRRDIRPETGSKPDQRSVGNGLQKPVGRLQDQTVRPGRSVVFFFFYRIRACTGNTGNT